MRPERPRAHPRTRTPARKPRPALAIERLEDRTVPAFLDVGGLRFDAGANPITDGQPSGAATIGFTPTGGEQFKPLLVTGSVTVNGSQDTFQVADLRTVGGAAVPLVNAQDTFDISSLTGTAGEPLAAASVTVAGYQFATGTLFLTNPNGGTTTDAVARLSGSLTLPAPIGVTVALDPTQGEFIEFDGTTQYLTGLDVTLNTTFSAGALTFTATDLEVSYTKADDKFTATGGASVTIGGDAVSVEFVNDPANGLDGLVITGGKLTNLDVAVTADLSLFGLDVQVGGENGTDPLTFDYDAGTGTYAVGGEVKISELFSVAVDLGDKGLTVETGKDGNPHFKLSTATLEVGGVDLGAFELNDLSITVTDGRFTSGTLDVTFPGGWEVGGTVTFDGSGQLEDISVALTFGDEGIEIGDTGAFLVEVDASLQNLDQPSNLVVSGTVAVSYGGSLNVTVGGEDKSASLFIATGSFTVDSQMLKLDAGGYLGAYKDDGGDWQGAIASGTADLTLDWGAGKYSADVSVTYYSVIEMSGSITFDRSGDVTIIAEADVVVPPEIPFIGGHKVGGMDFVFVYHKADKTGFAAAWVELDIIRTFDIGVLYNLDGTYRVIGNKDIQIGRAHV